MGVLAKYGLAAGLFSLSATASASYGPWEPANQKASLMVVSAHPDDEGIFFGGMLPYYAKVRHMQVALVDMITDYVDRMPADTRGRKEELRNAAAHSGLRIAPVFADMNDCALQPGGIYGGGSNWDAWDGNLTDGVADNNNNGVPDGREAGALVIARQIRRFRPEVIVSHDLNGEYGHQGHVGTAVCTADAFELAADPDVDIDGLPAWSAKKLYLHLYDQHKLFHTGWEKPESALDGKTARQVADESLDFHVSQLRPDVSTFYRTGENHDGYDSERWGLYASRVGWDPEPPTTPPDDVPPGPGLPSGYTFGDFFANIAHPGHRTYELGDANFDGSVDFTDLVTLARHYREANPARDVLTADFNLDGETNFEDLVQLARHYGMGPDDESTFSGPGVNAAFAADWTLAQSLVPEPVTVAATVGVAATLLARRRRL